MVTSERKTSKVSSRIFWLGGEAKDVATIEATEANASVEVSVLA